MQPSDITVIRSSRANTFAPLDVVSVSKKVIDLVVCWHITVVSVYLVLSWIRPVRSATIRSRSARNL